ncbi:nitrilase-related carbon-nitrogen hydrolase [Halopseudomonas pachastrellae]|nr:nitrilase-related carbon-nitrogen hydrolase [Halopseudomonas pachastrellae]
MSQEKQHDGDIAHRDAQLNMRVGDIPGNLARIIEAARHARDELGARVIVFPELSLCGYPPEDLLLRSSMQARISRALDSLCEEVSGIYMVVGTPGRRRCLLQQGRCDCRRPPAGVLRQAAVAQLPRL